MSKKLVLLSSDSYSDYGVDAIVSIESLTWLRKQIKQYNTLMQYWRKLYFYHRRESLLQDERDKNTRLIIDQIIKEFSDDEIEGFFTLDYDAPSFNVSGIEDWLAAKYPNECQIIGYEEINITEDEDLQP